MWKLFLSVFLLTTLPMVVSETECPWVPFSPVDRRENASRLRIVQFNVEWLFLDYYPPMDCPGDGCTWSNQTEVNTHFEHIVHTLRELNPDIVNFCEIEGCDELNALQSSLQDTTYRSYLKQGTDTSTGQNVGMLTRIDPLLSLQRSEQTYSYPIQGSACGYTGEKGHTGVSKHYITEFRWFNLSVAFIGAHLLAFPTDPHRCAQREAQAMVLHDVIAEYIQRQYEVIVLGDFNDYDGEIEDVNAHQPTSRVLSILKGEWTGNYTLYNVASLLPREERYTDWWDSDYNCDTQSVTDFSMIDHVLVTPILWQSHIEKIQIYHGYTEHCGKYDSDHFPVVIDLHA